MNDALELVTYCGAAGFGLAILAAMVTAPLALIALLSDQIAGRWMTARVRCWLWGLVAVRLVLPIAPESSVSAVNLWRIASWSEQDVATNHVDTDVPEYLARQSVENSGKAINQLAPAQNSVAEVLIEGREGISGLVAITSEEWEQFWFADEATAEAYESSFIESVTSDWETILFVSMICVWLLGATVVLLRAMVASLRFARKLHRMPELDYQPTLSIVLQACDQIGVRRPRVKCVPGLPTPALFGAWRPTLCLPEDSQQSLSDDQLRLVALHEAMHIRRGDGYLAWLLTIVRAIHWFNPVAWFAIKQIENYRELACDDGVRQSTQPQDHETYADLLLRFASGRPVGSLGLLGLWFARSAHGKDVARRIKALNTKERKSGRLARASTAVMLLSLAVVGLTDAASTHAVELPEQPKLPVFSVSEPSAWDARQANFKGQQSPLDPEEIETHEYDLTEAIEKVDDVPKNMTPEDWLLLWCKAPHWKRTSVEFDNEDPNRVTITMSKLGHRHFEQMLAEFCRVGHVGQIAVTTRIMSSEHVEKLIDKDWLGTIKYAAPEPISSSQWEKSEPQENGDEFSLSMEAVSFEYAPYTAFIVDDERMGRIVRYFASNEDVSIINAPKVTLFSGQSALITDESHTPFVYGMQSIKGEHAEALQPNITVIPEGLKVDLQAFNLDDEAVDLRCRLTLSSLDGVTEATLPGADVTVQTPKATRRTVNVHCRLSSGETLLVAPIAGQRSDGKKTHYYAITAEQIFQDELIED